MAFKINFSDQFYPNHYKLYLVITISLFGLLFVTETLLNISGLYVVLAGVLLILGALMVVLKRLQQGDFENYRQLEAIFSLYAVFTPRQPLPTMRKWAASPDFLCEIAKVILREKPKFTLEMGSGVSTVVIGYLLEKNGIGSHVAVDHSRDYAEKTQGLLTDHALNEYAEVRCAPLRKVKFGDDEYNWYNRDSLPEHEIDLLIVDGPPRSFGPYSRYPALPILIDRLSDGAHILIDDANTSSVSSTIERWRDEFKDLKFEDLRLEKGGVLMRVESN